MKLLCLSNGHGEDAIGCRILKALQQHPQPPELAALPLVGAGRSYEALGIPIIASVKVMPSGGFVYMDGRQLVRDLKGGLLQLTWMQFKAVRSWGRSGGVILAVGDILPLLLAWVSGAPYAFVGTAKSEYSRRDEAGILPRRDWLGRLESRMGSVYFPWERWLMSRPTCKAVFPRDHLTAETLGRSHIPTFDLGNPMMDDLEPTGISFKSAHTAQPLTIVLLPGSRAPEVYDNWQRIVEAVAGVILTFANRPLLFLGAIAPSLDLELLADTLISEGWKRGQEGQFSQQHATLILTQTAFNDCLHEADVAIGMAGTATEQFVGLGKPAVTLIGRGPQFTPTFAKTQARHLGPSVTLVERSADVGRAIGSLLSNPDRLHLIAENGHRRMGQPGAARKIAEQIMRISW